MECTCYWWWVRASRARITFVLMMGKKEGVGKHICGFACLVFANGKHNFYCFCSVKIRWITAWQLGWVWRLNSTHKLGTFYARPNVNIYFWIIQIRSEQFLYFHKFTFDICNACSKLRTCYAGSNVKTAICLQFYSVILSCWPTICQQYLKFYYPRLGRINATPSKKKSDFQIQEIIFDRQADLFW